MKDFASLVQAVLVADATLLTSLTGGLYLYKSLPHAGITRTNTSAVFDSAGKRKPYAIVKGRATVAFGGITDKGDVSKTVRQVVEVWLYADSDAGFSTLETASKRIYLLLENKWVGDATGGGKLAIGSQIQDFDRDQNNAVFIRSDYTLVGYMKA